MKYRLFSRALLAATALSSALAISPAVADPFVYLTHYGDSRFSVIDAATNTNTTPTLTTLPSSGGVGPRGVAVSPDGKRIYIANNVTQTGAAFPGTLSVIDAATKTIIGAPIPMSYPSDVAISPDGKRVYVANNGLATVSVLDTTTNTVLAPISGAPIPRAIAVSIDSKRVYIAAAGGIYVADATSGAIVATIPIFDNVTDLAVSPDGKRVYASKLSIGDFGMTNKSHLLVIDTQTNSVVPIELPNLTAGSSAGDIAVTPDGKSVYVADSRAGRIWVVDAATNAVSDIPVSSGVHSIAFTPDGKRAYAPLNATTNTVGVINASTKTVVGSIPVAAAFGSTGIPAPGIIGVLAPPTGLPFAAMTASLSVSWAKDYFQLSSRFTASSQGNGILPLTEPVRLLVGPYLVTIPAGSFKMSSGSAVYSGIINGVTLRATIKPLGGLNYSFNASAKAANLMRGATNSVPVSYSIGDDAGRISINTRL